jgi:fibro-slime domain-containing protein
MWDDGIARPQLLEVEELTDRAIARVLASLETEANALSIDSIGSGIFAPLHAGFAGGNVARFSAEIAEVESLIETPPSKPGFRTIGAIVRDFRPSDDIDGNPDFARKGGAHSGTWVNLVKPDLGARQRPEFNDDPGAARKAKDLRFETRDGYEIHASLFNEALGDRSFPIGGGGNSGEPIRNPGNFATWFEDDGVSNSSRPVLLELERVMAGPTESFVFELSETDHPVKGRLFGEVSDLSEIAPGEGKKRKKRAFTMETVLEFVRDTSADQRFEVTSSGDLWVFLNGRLVAEIGAGGKSRQETTQVVPIERLGIADGMPCEIRIFFAHREESPTAHARLRFASTFEVSTPLAFVRDTPYTAPDTDAKAIRNARQSTLDLHNGGGLGTPQYAERRLANWMRRFE